MSRRAATILIVDDEAQNRKLLEALLRPEGYLTLTAANGEEALASIAQRAPDLILLDVMMPDMDGYQVAARLKADPATSNIPIIMVTAQVDRGARLAGLDAGAEEFLTKPVDRAELWLRVRNLLRLKEYGDFLQNHGAILEEQVQSRTADLQRYQAAMDATADSMYLVDRSSMLFVCVNEAACRMQGRTREALLALAPADVLSTSRAELESTYDAVIASGVDAKPLQLQRRRKDGSTIWVEMRLHAHRSGDHWMIVTLERDVTELRVSAQELSESDRRFSDLLQNVELVSLMLDREAQITYCNEYLLRLTGWRHEEVIGRNWFELFVPPENDEAKSTFLALLVNEPEAWHHESEILTCSGGRRLIRWNNSVLRSGAGDVIGTASIGEDITEQKRAEIRIRRLNRVYVVLSGINTLIVRVRDRAELFREACRIAVEQGNFGIAWIGDFDPATLDVTPVAWAGLGAKDYLGSTKSTARGDVPQGQGAVGRAIRELRPVCINDLSAEPSAGSVRREEAVARGYRSVIVLPLIVGGAAVGNLSLFAREINFFDDEEVKLLAELAGDISFALENIGRQQKLDRLSRIRAVSGEINAAIARVRHRQELLDAACRIAVEQAGFPLAWIGMLDPATRDLRAAAMAGTIPEYGKRLQPSVRGDVPGGQGTNGRAFREQKPVVDNDMLANPGVGAAREEGLRRGIRAALSLPLMVEGAPVGVMGLYATEKDYFDEGEVSLLAEIAGNIAFALEHMARQEKIEKLARIRAVSSEINATIIRIRDREALLRETCRIAVEHGKFELVWIGTVDAAQQQILPVAWHGFSTEIAERVSWTSSRVAGGTLGEAVRTAKPTVRNDIETEMTSGGMRAEALKRGCLSTVCMPLVVDGEVVALISIFAAGKAFFDEGELLLLNEVAADVSFALQAMEKQKKLEYLSHYDVLTGLPNRTLFHETLKKTLALAADRGWLVAVLCIDLDLFKNVNDTLGHACGDALLAQLSSRLLRCVRIRDTVGRLGGDEFALILLMEEGKEGAAHVANKIREALRAPFDLKGHTVTVAASIGITIYPDDASDPETLMKYADTAMYRAKQAGRDTFRFFTAQMNTEVVARLDLETALRKAIENDEFVLHYQPKVQLSSGRIAGVEALLRWQRPGHGLVPPNQFIPVLEETGLIVRVGSWVVSTACRQIAQWMRTPIGPVQISVNVAGRQFIEGDLHGDVVKALGDSGIAPDLLELELTESSLMANTEATVAILGNLEKLGVRISIDDFGTGYSSLAYLSRFPIHKLKIDIAFIRDVTSNPDHAAIVLAIIRMAHGLKLDVIAEGVETAAQLAYLRRHHCDLIQGYFFSRPLPLSELEEMLLEEKRLPAAEDEAGKPLKTLLLVDDDASVLDVLQRLLLQDGYNILSARSAAEGFELLALHAVQVILCDQRMADTSGTAFLGRVKYLYPDTFRIVLSAHTDPETIMEAINRGAIHRYYTKPWDSKVLRENIREAFRQYWLLHDTSLKQGSDPNDTLPPRRLAAPDARQKRAPAPIPVPDVTR